MSCQKTQYTASEQVPRRLPIPTAPVGGPTPSSTPTNRSSASTGVCRSSTFASKIPAPLMCSFWPCARTHKRSTPFPKIIRLTQSWALRRSTSMSMSFCGKARSTNMGSIQAGAAQDGGPADSLRHLLAQNKFELAASGPSRDLDIDGRCRTHRQCCYGRLQRVARLRKQSPRRAGHDFARRASAQAARGLRSVGADCRRITAKATRSVGTLEDVHKSGKIQGLKPGKSRSDPSRLSIRLTLAPRRRRTLALATWCQRCVPYNSPP